MEKKPFVTKSQVEEIVKTYPTPFHLYDEKGISENATKVKEAFADVYKRQLVGYLYLTDRFDRLVSLINEAADGLHLRL